VLIKDKKIIVTGGAGFLGSFVVEKLVQKGVPKENILIPRSKDYDLRKAADIEKMFSDFKCDIVINLASKVGGIGLNMEKPGELFYDNIMMGVQLMEYARLNKVEKFISIGSICAYPKFTPVPFKEENLWGGYPEETNAPYGLAKKMSLVQSQAYRKQYGFNSICLLLVNLYGPKDNFDPKSSHVIPALIKKISEAREKGEDEVVVWGDGNATREFLFVEDAAEGIVLATEKYDKSEPLNLGKGFEISIKELVNMISRLMDYEGKIVWDDSKPNGQPRRCLDVSKAKKELDFQAKTDLETGLRKSIDWYESNKSSL
jgi:GDP-L-fucose synthase